MGSHFSMQKYVGIQALRFVAAALVVIAHTTQAILTRLHGGDDTGYWVLGTFGVDIFFVISGFIMASTTKNAPVSFESATQFFVRRLIRVVPLYWIYTTLKLLIVGLVPASSTKVFPSFEHIVASYLFIPHVDASGGVWPALPVGWTLNYEMFFYLVFAVAISLTRFRATTTAVVFLGMGVLAALSPGSTVLSFLGDSLLLEFLFGVAIARGIERWQPMGRVGGVVAPIAAMLMACWLLSLSTGLPRSLAWGVPAALIVGAVVVLEPQLKAVSGIRAVSPLGDASYSLYLSHAFSVPALVAAFGVFGVGSDVLMIVVTLVISTALSLLSYRWMEQPIAKLLSRPRVTAIGAFKS